MAEAAQSRTRPRCWPFVATEEDVGCELYWIGLPAFPAPSPHRAWLTRFMARFSAEVERELELRGEFFLEFKAVIGIERRFRALAVEVAPWPGLSRKPKAVLPHPPSKEEMEAILEGKPYDVRDFFPDACYWLHADQSMLMKEFFGFGGASMFYLPPDPSAKPAKIPHLDELKKALPQIDFDKFDRIVRTTVSLREPFLAESKKLFGPGLEEEPSWEGISFILPLLETQDFFTQPAEEKKKWFQLFDIFWRESPPDRGLYIASSKPIEPLIAGIVEDMKEAGHFHPDDELAP